MEIKSLPFNSSVEFYGYINELFRTDEKQNFANSHTPKNRAIFGYTYEDDVTCSYLFGDLNSRKLLRQRTLDLCRDLSGKSNLSLKGGFDHFQYCSIPISQTDPVELLSHITAHGKAELILYVYQYDLKNEPLVHFLIYWAKDQPSVNSYLEQILVDCGQKSYYDKLS